MTNVYVPAKKREWTITGVNIPVLEYKISSCTSMIALKNFLVQNGWSIIGSKGKIDGGYQVGWDSIDRWNQYSCLIDTWTNGVKCWMVLNHNGPNGNIGQLMLWFGGWGYQPPGYTFHPILSPSSLFTWNGNTNNRPIATDEVNCSMGPTDDLYYTFRPWGNDYFSWSPRNNPEKQLYFWVDSKQENYFFVCLQRDDWNQGNRGYAIMPQPLLLTYLQENEYLSSWTNRGVCSFKAYYSSGTPDPSIATEYLYWRTDPTNQFQEMFALSGRASNGAIVKYRFTHPVCGYYTSLFRANDVNDGKFYYANTLSNQYYTHPVGIFANYNGVTGYQGPLDDVFCVSSNLGMGTAFPEDGTKQWIKFGALIFPWDGSTPNLPEQTVTPLNKAFFKFGDLQNPTVTLPEVTHLTSFRKTYFGFRASPKLLRIK